MSCTFNNNELKEHIESDDIYNSSSGCDMSFEFSSENVEIHQHQNVSVEVTSPTSPISNKDDDYLYCENNNRFLSPIPNSVPISPPYKRVRALRLFDSPLTPKTIIQKSSSATPKSRLFGDKSDKPRGVPCAYAKTDKPLANVNPFTPNGMLLSKKRRRSMRYLGESSKINKPLNFDDESDTSDVEIEQPTKRVALTDSNISRYHQEFLELELIGKGQFGSVFKCINRLDGCVYAIKKSTKPVAGSHAEKTALREVYAHSVLGKHHHVVRYYSAWAENNHMLIQSEYCNGGSLADKISLEALSAAELRRLLLHVAEGLRYIHSEGLVHLDIKPGNIFISIEKKMNITNYDSADDGFEDLEESRIFEEELTYKIGDLGHVTSLSDPQVEEGDCRYLPMEILQEDFAHLTKADVFALGLTALECAGSGPLPKNGPKWHALRRGELPTLPQTLTRDLMDLIRTMIRSNPCERPSTLQLLQCRALNPDCTKSKAALTRELNAEKMRNEVLVKQLKEAVICINSIAKDKRKVPNDGKSNSRLIGKQVNRSISSTIF